MSTNWVTATGFKKKTLAEIKTELETSFQRIFGNDIDLDPSGPFGEFIGILSKREADLWDGAEEIHTSRNPEQATGTSLDNIVSENGIQRLPAIETQVSNVLLTGTEGTIIATGKRAKKPTQTIEYTLEADVMITKAIARQGTISVASVAAGTYTIIINAVPYFFIAAGTETALAILGEIKTQIDAGAWAGSTILDTDNELLIIQDYDTNFNFDIVGNLNIDDVSSVGDFIADTAGDFTLPANSLTEIVTPVSGWDSVLNPAAGATGKNTETDNELRIRRIKSILSGNAVEDAIREKLLNEVPDVLAVIIKSNRTNVVDSDGRPPTSFECVVTGGDDEPIAEKILEVQAAGIESYGNVIVPIIDSQGFSQTIKFSRAEDKFAWVRVSRNKYDEEIYPESGDGEIKDAIVKWSLNNENIDIGKDIIRQRLSTPIYTVPGIADIIIEIAITDNPGDAPAYVTTDIPIQFREIAVFAVSRIIVQDIP